MAYEGGLKVNGYSVDTGADDQINLGTQFNNFLICLRIFGWIVIGLTVVGLILGIVVSFLAYDAEYSASATFTISPQRSDADEDFGFNTTFDNQLVSSETYVITSTSMKEMIVDELGENYNNCLISASAMEDTNLVTVTVTADTKAKAYQAIKQVITDFPKISLKIYGDVNVSLLDEVEASDTPVNASTKKLMILGGAGGGLLLGLVIIFLYSLNLNLVSDTDTLQKYANAECLGSVPRVVFKNKKVKNIVTITNRNMADDFRESFQYMRTRIERFCRRDFKKTILVTSTYPGEGKTTTTINIALSLSQNGKKVIIIDGDLRNPSVTDRFGAVAGKYGLNDVLRGKCKFEDALTQIPGTQVYILTCNKPMFNAAEAINSAEMTDVVEKAKEAANYVIIDSPPTEMMGDSISLAKYADASMFVVRQNYGKLNNIIYAIEAIKETNAELIGFVLNGAYDKAKFSDYGAYNNYKYGKYNKYANN